MQEIHFPLYRDYREAIRQANDAVAALLVGSRLSAHVLQLNAGSRHPLSELFPRVEHIRRFNLQTSKAQSLLRDADHHLASITIPYVLAIHEDFVKSAFNYLATKDSSTGHRKSVRAHNMHEELFNVTNSPAPDSWLASFHTLRTIRNTIIHSGGIVDEGVSRAIEHMNEEAVSGWTRITGQPPQSLLESATVTLKAEHIFIVFAVVKQLGREINAAYISFLERPRIAKECVQDFYTVNNRSKSPKTRNSSGWKRSLVAHAKFLYKDMRFTEDELLHAARSLGLWTLKD